MHDGIIEHIKQYFTDTRFEYHSLAHTMSVFREVARIGGLEEVEKNELALLQIAALFHDTGYATNPTIHEEVGAGLAETYLTSKGFSIEDIKQVKKLILATRILVPAESKLEKIIKDADLAHLGMESFAESSNFLRNEKAAIDGSNYNEQEWIEDNLEFLNAHKWNTKGAKKLYNKTKKQNLALLKDKYKSSKKEEASKIPEKGVETMYRVALRNHNQLSKIADNKANILLSITAIMLSLILSSLAPKIDSNPRLLIPTVMIIIVNLVTMMYAILATRPKVTSAPYTRESFLSNKVNILFFGNFYKMPLDEFEWGMKQLMENRDLLYGSLSKDLYFLGSVLAKKYRYLQHAYAIFMIGMIISTLGFVWAFAVWP